jgi:hypothetical protein
MLNHGWIDQLFPRRVFTISCYSRVDGVIGLNGGNSPIPDSYLENTLVETVISTGSIPDDIIAMTD